MHTSSPVLAAFSKVLHLNTVRSGLVNDKTVIQKQSQVEGLMTGHKGDPKDVQGTYLQP